MLPNAYYDHLLMHEFGHILQAKDKGLLFYYFIIATISLGSAFCCMATVILAGFAKKLHLGIEITAYRHHNTWTEWDASRRAKIYFQKIDWQEKWFPTKSG